MKQPRPALLCTADGEVFTGSAVGAEGIGVGEAVFNTSMTGYQEIITDPSYAGQVVVMTSPHIGNYGTTEEDDQSSRPFLSGLVVRSLSRRDSSWRSTGTIEGYLRGKEVVGIADVDTRRLTRRIRDRGAMPVAIGADVDEQELCRIAAEAPTMHGQNLAYGVSTPASYRVDAEREPIGSVVTIDLGTKRDILRNLTRLGYSVTVVPADTDADVIMALDPDGVFVSNGPGDPAPLTETVRTLRALVGRVPVFGICLGHQVLGLASGAETFKLPFGHHGGNHPVRRLSDGKVEITAQNHGFSVDLWCLTDHDPPARSGLPGPDLLPTRVETDFGELVPTHQNLNDGTLEGMSFPDAGAFSVQYHPEAAPGPRDAVAMFDDFCRMMRRS